MGKIKLFKVNILLYLFIYSFVVGANNIESTTLVSSVDSTKFSIIVIATKDLKFSNRFLTKPEIPKVAISNNFKTNETFEIITIFKNYTLDKKEAKIIYGIKITDPKGKDYYVNTDLKFSQKNLQDSRVLLIDPKQFLRMKFENSEAKGLYRVYIFAVDIVSKQRAFSEVLIEHK